MTNSVIVMVQGLSSSQLLDVWESAEGRHPVEQALVILVATCDQPRDELETLSLGVRDGLLLQMRAQTFGDDLSGWVICPQCGERLEFSTNVTAIQPSPAIAAQTFDTCIADAQITMRLPNSRDLLAIRVCADVVTARRQLLERCIESVFQHDHAVSVSEINEDGLEQLVVQLGEHDPQSEILLALSCAACGACWSALVDIGAFFWREIAAQAQRLLREVHLLASAYGWREDDILVMSARRRQSYLNLIETD